MVNALGYFKPAFATLKDVEAGPLPEEKVAAVAPGQWDKLVVTFESGLALSLNATNTRALVRAFGPETDRWIGGVVELFAGEVEFAGKPQAAVLVRAISAPEPRDESESHDKPESRGESVLDDEIPF